MKQRLIIASAIVCAACSSDPDIKPVPPTEMPPTETPPTDTVGNASGSRLRRIDRLAADGAREFVGWYDSERDEECHFYAVSEALWRCLPKFETDGATGYLDDKCTRMASTSYRALSTGYVALATGSGEEMIVRAIYRVLGAVDEETKATHQLINETCTPLENPGSVTVEIEVVEMDEFVSAIVTHE